jgi:hypothetical protein
VYRAIGVALTGLDDKAATVPTIDLLLDSIPKRANRVRYDLLPSSTCRSWVICKAYRILSPILKGNWNWAPAAGR